jgi:hypothetical protein
MADSPPMLTVEARIETERASRYLVQLCKHAAGMGGSHGHRPHLHAGAATLARKDVQVHAEWSETRGTVDFTPLGRCTIQADAAALTVHVEATDEEGLRQIQHTIGRDLDSFGRRDELTVRWRRPDTASGQPGNDPAA